MGDYSNAIKFLDKELEYYGANNKSFLAIMGLCQKIDAILRQGTNLENNYLNALYKRGVNISEEADADVIGLNGLYTSMGLIKIIQEDYNSALKILSKSSQIGKELQAADDTGIIDNTSAIFITYCKKMLGEDISSRLEDLERRLKRDTHFGHVDAYYLYKIFGTDKGKKYLKEGFNTINDMKTHLKDKALEEFCNARYVTLISEEWDKINN